MTTRRLSYTITLDGNAVTDLTECTVDEGFNQSSTRFSMLMRTLPACVVNDAVSITLGYVVAGVSLVFTGFIDDIQVDNPPGLTTVVGRDSLKRAAEHLLVPANTQDPAFTRLNISAEDLVEALLAECGLLNYGSDVSGYTFLEPEFSLDFVYGAIERVCGILQWHCYADTAGKVWFKDIKPVPVGAAAHNFVTGAAGNLLVINYRESDSDLRNKVVVFGKDPITATVSAASPYVPAGYFKTAVVASSLIDTQAMADGAAAFNLTAWNKLTEIVEAEAEGDPDVHVRDTVFVQDAFTGRNENWFVYTCSHRFGVGGTYKLGLSLIK